MGPAQSSFAALLSSSASTLLHTHTHHALPKQRGEDEGKGKGEGKGKDNVKDNIEGNGDNVWRGQCRGQ